MKKLSRKIVWLLLIVFVFTVGSGFSLRRSAALPGVGEQLSGFRVETIERLDTPGGKTAYLTHEATGAAVVYIEDTGASPALTLMARTTDGLRRVTLTADSVAELLRGAKESLGAFFGAETEAVPEKEHRWTNTKVAAILLVYGIHVTGSVDEGNAEIGELAALFEKHFHVDLGNVYHAFGRLRGQQNPTAFLDEMKERLLKKMRDMDSR